MFRSRKKSCYQLTQMQSPSVLSLLSVECSTTCRLSAFSCQRHCSHLSRSKVVSSFWHPSKHTEVAYLCLGSSKFCMTCIEYSYINWTFYLDSYCFAVFASPTNISCNFSFYLQEIFASSTNQQDFSNNLSLFYRYTGNQKLKLVWYASHLSMDVSERFSLFSIATSIFLDLQKMWMEWISERIITRRRVLRSGVESPFTGCVKCGLELSGVMKLQ